MQYAFRLAELLGHTPDRRKRPGTIKAIVEYTGLDRHQVAALLKNEAKYIPIEALSRLCDYLVEHGYATADQLPGALFAVKPEHFWELLARRKRLEICVGVRRQDAEDSPGTAWVVASDSVLLGEVLNGVSTLGGTAKHIQTTAKPMGHSRGLPPHPEHLKQSLVWSPGQVPETEARQRAASTYQDFCQTDGDKALVCVGSVKSNPVVELTLAETFGSTPFHSEDDVANPSDRKIPFFLRYRERDPHPPSNSAGLKLSVSSKSTEPGIYYEQKDGSWAYAGGNRHGEDVALVFYIYRESLGRLDMVLSGFSGKATRYLARTLASRAEDFWPPIFSENYLQVGAFIVQYKQYEDAGEEGPTDILRTDLVAATNVIPIPAEAIARRLNR